MPSAQLREGQLSPDSDFDVLVVGAGVAGIGAGIKLKQAGFGFCILEQAHEVGGTWRDHRYPGLTVDIPSLMYSFSFEQKPDWSSLWAPQAEVFDYCRKCVRKYDLRPHIRFGEQVVEARFDEHDHIWTVTTAAGRAYRTRYVINGSGYLSVPRLPDIPGIDSFTGQHLHTSQWTESTDVTGQRVALIGTGATAIQIAPEIAPLTARLQVFQRTPIWLLPKPPMVFGPLLQKVFARIPGVQRIARLATAGFMDMVFFRVFTDYRQVAWIAKAAEALVRRHIRRNVEDPAVADALTPNFSWGCKRPSFSNTFYPMFNRDNVELVTEPIAAVTADGIVTADGTTRNVDAIVYATGYQPFEKSSLPTYPVFAADGTELRQYWDDNRYQAFRGYTVNGFPNFFLVFGPYSVVSSSYFAMVEIAVRHIVHALDYAKQRGYTRIEVTESSQRRELEWILNRKKRSIWNVANCAGSKSYYVDRFGDTPGFRPNYQPWEWVLSHTRNMRHFDFRALPSRQRAPDAVG